MPSFIIFLCLTIFGAHAVVSEGFLRQEGKVITLEKPVDSRVVLPTFPPCSPDALKEYIDVYVRLEWERDPKKNCFVTKKVVPAIYDPLKSSGVTK